MSEAPVKELYRGRADGVRGDEGSGGFIRPTAGCRLQTTSPRCCATPAARVGPPPAQGYSTRRIFAPRAKSFCSKNS